MESYKRSNTGTGAGTGTGGSNGNKMTVINMNNINSKVQVNKGEVQANHNKVKPITSGGTAGNKMMYHKQISTDNTFKTYDEFKVKPTAKLRSVKLADPFSSKSKHASNFGHLYSAGGIPCHILHGNIQMRIQWDKDIETVDYESILVAAFEGLVEMEHPYKFASRQCSKELMAANGAYDKIVPLLGKVYVPLRVALGSTVDEVFLDACDITIILSDLVKEKLNPYINYLLQVINKRVCGGKYKEKGLNVLRALEKNGGEEALKCIKAKIPTYMG